MKSRLGRLLVLLWGVAWVAACGDSSGENDMTGGAPGSGGHAGGDGSAGASGIAGQGGAHGPGGGGTAGLAGAAGDGGVAGSGGAGGAPGTGGIGGVAGVAAAGAAGAAGQPGPFRSEPPWRHPFHHESFWNTPVGSGAVYVPTDASRHTSTFSGSGFNLNYNNWTDPIYLATDADPLMEIEKRANLPSGWSELGNDETGGTSGQGAFEGRYTGVRIPADATWQSTSNTDRKVIVVQPEVTLQRYDASNELISTQTYPAGTLSIEMHKFYRVTGGTKILTTNLSYSDLRGHGMGYGAIASGVSMSQGYVRRWEIDAALDGDHTAIRHALKLGLPNSKLQVGQIWPASYQDGDAASSYSGQNPMGTMMVLDRDTNIDELAYSGSSQAQRLQKAFAWTLQNFGGYVLIRAGSGPITLGVEATPPHLGGTLMTAVRTGLTDVVFPHLRIVSNSHDVGALSPDRSPVDPSLIAGGGTRNEAIRPLPIDPDGPWL